MSPSFTNLLQAAQVKVRLLSSCHTLRPRSCCRQSSPQPRLMLARASLSTDSTLACLASFPHLTMAPTSEGDTEMADYWVPGEARPKPYWRPGYRRAGFLTLPGGVLTVALSCCVHTSSSLIVPYRASQQDLRPSHQRLGGRHHTFPC